MVNKKRVSKVLVFVLLIGTLLSSVAFAADVDTTDWVVAEDIKIKTTAHIQKDDDKDFSGNGQIWFGTTGEKKRVEEISIGLEGEVPEDMRIMYMVHVQKDGDTKWTEGPNPAGTHGEAKRIEGIAIKLVDEAGKEYPGYVAEYQVHMAQYGWGINKTKNDKNDDNKINDSYKEWASNGTYAGTRGEARRIEAVRLRIRREDELKVKSVSAINGTQAEVKFNKEVKEVKPANFKVTDKDGNLLFVSKAELNEEKTVATLSFFDAFADKGVYTVEVSNVADVDGNVMEKATAKFGYEKADVAKVEFTSTIIKESGKLADIVKVTDKLGRDVTKEVEVEFASADTSIINDAGLAQSGQNGKEVLVTATVKDTKVTTKAVIKVSESAAKTFVGYTIDTNLAVDTDAFNKLEADKIYNYVSVSDKKVDETTDNRKTLAVYALDQYGKSINKITAFESVENLTPNVVIVSKDDGKVTPISEGTGYVKVKSGAVEKTLQINVRAEAQVQDIEVDPAAVEVVEKGLAGKIKLTYKDQFGGETSGDAAKLTVKSSDATVATATKINANEIKVEGHKAGTAKITLTYKYTVGTNEVVIEKEAYAIVSEKGNFADYEVAVPRTTLYSEDNEKTTTDEREVQITVYQLDDKGQRIATSAAELVALDKDNKVEETPSYVSINGMKVAYKAAGTQKVQVKVGSVVVDTIEFTTVNNTPGEATTVVFDNTAIVAGEIEAEKFEESINTHLEKIVTLKDKFGDKVEVKEGDKVNFEYIITNKDGVELNGAANEETIKSVTKQNATADVVVTKVTLTPSGKSATDNLLAAPQVVKLSVKDTKAPVITGVENGKEYQLSEELKKVTPASEAKDIKTVTLTKDGEVVSEYTELGDIKEAGEYVLTVTDNAGNKAVINFTILAASAGDSGVEG